MTVTKIDIIEFLSKKHNLNKADAKMLVEGFFEEIRIALASGEEVKYQALVILNCAIRLRAQDAIQKPGKAYRFQHVVSFPLNRDKNYAAALNM